MVVASETDILDNTPRNQYTASANQTKFDYDFVIFDEDDLVIVETTDPGGSNESTSTLTRGASNDYTVSGVGNENGGTVELTSGASDGTRITIQRSVKKDRKTDFLQSGDYMAEDINTELDLLVMMLQELSRDLDRTPTLSIESTADSITFPDPDPNKVLGWNANNELANVASVNYQEDITINADSTKTITHNLENKNVFVQVYNDSGQQVTMERIELVDKNSLEIENGAPVSFSGKVLVSA